MMIETEATTQMTPPRTNIGNMVRRIAPLALIGVAALGAFLFLRDYLSFEALAENREALIAWRDGSYLLALLTYVAVYAVVVALSLPGAIWLTLGGGFLFGALMGTTAAVVGATIGATGIFLAARTAIGDMLRKKAGAAIARMEAGFREDSVSYMLFLRLVPVFPFWLVNLAPAFLGVSLITFFWTTLVGIVPGTLVFSWVGAGLGEVFARGETPDLSIIFDPAVLGPILGLAALSVTPIIIKRLRARKAGEARDEPHQD